MQPLNDLQTRMGQLGQHSRGPASRVRKDFPKDANQFIVKHGWRHHSFDPEKAPYPMCYDRQILELEPLANVIQQYLRKSVSFHNWDSNKPPTRVLDLGCGLGAWVIEAAKQWPECTFVGFDMMNIQIPPYILEPSLVDRIQWVHGNFLTTKLPFEDDEFDYVHLTMVNHGIPENKWSPLYEELNRVMCSGAIIEQTEDDILFPKLPKWFTNPLRGRSQPIPVQAIRNNRSPVFPPLPELPHAHVFLESLYYDVFQTRFINIKPTSVLTVYFSAFFKVLEFGPVIEFPMPPFTLPASQAPPPPCPISRANTFDARRSSTTTLSEENGRPSIETRKPSLSFSSMTSDTFTTSSRASSIYSSDASTADTSNFSAVPPLPNRSPPRHAEKERDVVTPVPRFQGTDLTERQLLRSTLPTIERTVGAYTTVNPHAFEVHDDVFVSQLPRQPLIPRDVIKTLSERSLIMHLYRAYQVVLSCREAMWGELKRRLLNRPGGAMFEGWDDDQELQELSSDRKKFDRLIERYRSDMEKRLTLWASLAQRGESEWPLPSSAPMSKIDLVEEERLRQAMIEAMKEPSSHESAQLCRCLRHFIGVKSDQERSDIY